MPAAHSSILALDVGDKRVGVAVASTLARLPRPLVTLIRNEDFFKELNELVNHEDVGEVVIGLPRDMSGRSTSQTEATEQFIDELKSQLDVTVYTQDEAVTSKRAEEELDRRGRPYEKGDIDALAATYILEDFLNGYNRTDAGTT